MKRILITGATGNVGKEVIKALLQTGTSHTIMAGVRDVEKDAKDLPGVIVRHSFNFEDEASFPSAFSACDILFLLRPPHISQVKKYFAPLIEAAVTHGVGHIVFLSVQGAEKSRIIPHHKIERLITESGIPYTFLRPAYFMQNFTTTLQKNIREKQLIFLPAGHAKFTIIGAADIGRTAATVLLHPDEHIRKAYELTNDETLNFSEMADKISEGTGVAIRYQSPSLLHFFQQKRKEKMPVPFILVMIMLHFLPRFQKTPRTTDCVRVLTGREPVTFDEFVKENRRLLI